MLLTSSIRYTTSRQLFLLVLRLALLSNWLPFNQFSTCHSNQSSAAYRSRRIEHQRTDVFDLPVFVPIIPRSFLILLQWTAGSMNSSLPTASSVPPRDTISYSPRRNHGRQLHCKHSQATT